MSLQNRGNILSWCIRSIHSLVNTLVNDLDLPKEETKEEMFRYLNKSSSTTVTSNLS